MNLVETAAIFRKVLFTVIGVFTLYITIVILRPIVVSWIAKINPPQDPITASYGKIPPVVFQYKKITNSDPQYILNTKNGRLPNDLPEKLPVFRLRQPLFSYEAGKNAQRTGELLGYYDNTFISSTGNSVYLWEDPTFNSRLEINIDTKEIKLELPIYGKGNYYESNKLTEALATEQARNMLIASGRFSDLYYSGTTKAYFGKFVGSELRQIDYDYETQIVRVDFFRSFKSFPILGPDPYKGLIHVWVGVPKDPTYKQLNFPRVEVYQWELVDREEDKEATYPLIPINVAWQEVLKNNGVVAGIVARNGNPFEPYQPIRVDKILINKIYVAYYDTPKLQKYLQPIYVFEGNYTTVGGGAGQLAIYYPAVSGDYILPVEEQKQPSTPK